MMKTESFLQAAELGLQQSHHNFSADSEQLGFAPKKDVIGFPWDQLARRCEYHLPTEKLIKITDTLAVGYAQSVMAPGAENRAPDDGCPDERLKEHLILGLPLDPEGCIFLDILEITAVFFQQGLADLVGDVLG